jgi:hypothetical protein
MEDTWANRDLPVLDAIVRQLDELSRLGGGRVLQAADVAARTGLDVGDVAAALSALKGEYVTLVTGAGGASQWMITAVSADARRAVGQWPTGGSLVDRLAAGIDRAAENESDPEQKRRLLAVARGLGGAARAIAVNVASEMLEHRLPH